MVDLERDTEPLGRRRGIQFDFAALLKLLRELGSAQQRFAGPEQVFD